jgi:hypothetical protein
LLIDQNWGYYEGRFWKCPLFKTRKKGARKRAFNAEIAEFGTNTQRIAEESKVRFLTGFTGFTGFFQDQESEEPRNGCCKSFKGILTSFDKLRTGGQGTQDKKRLKFYSLIESC